jgi:hypothetical protein
MFSEDMEVYKIMRTLLTLGANSSPPRRHGSGQNNENITNTRGKLDFVHFHVFVECSSLHLVLVMFSLFCLLPCLRGVLEFVTRVSNVLIICPFPCVDKIMRTLLTLGANSSTPRRHGSGQNNENITNTRCSSLSLALVMFSLFCALPCLRGVLEFVTRVSNVLIICPLPCLRGVLEFAPSVSNVLIILSTSMSSWSARVCP